MRRIDTVLRGLLEHASSKAGVTAGELSAALGLSRANVSGDLNALCRDGLATKSATRPVRYRPTQAAREQAASHAPEPDVSPETPASVAASPAKKGSLDQFLECNPCMHQQVKLIRASVLYPIEGMHILMHGPTGVGKSMLARIVYDFAVESGRLEEGAPFVSFNCADYADNPQLLVSEFMGTRRGAYTGADEDRPGLIEKADGGVLFLDEVHRLPPQGQEMLFTYIDRGVFRRLGDPENERHARVLLVCATTENLSSSMLATFLRRIPMVVEIPSLAARSREERFSLIALFYTQEARRLGRRILVSVNTVRALLGYECPGNIGQLKSDIKLTCAYAYADFLGGSGPDVCFSSVDLPDYVRKGLYADKSRGEVWGSYLSENPRFCAFGASETPGDEAPSEDGPRHHDIYELIDERLEVMRAAGASEERISEDLSESIAEYFEGYLEKGRDGGLVSSVANIISPEVVEATDAVLGMASKRLCRSYSEDVRFGLAAHVMSAVSRLRRGLPSVNPRLNRTRKEHPEEFAVGLEAARIIEARFDVEVPLEEAGYLALFLVGRRGPEPAGVLVTVIAHGESTATSMVAAANRLLGTKGAAGIDAPLDQTPAEVYERLLELVRERRPQGVLCLVDMGSIAHFAEAIERDMGIPARSFSLVSTMHVIEAARKASLGASLSEVLEETARVSEVLGSVAGGGPAAAPRPAEGASCFVVAACTTGSGGADLLKGLLEKSLDRHGSFCEVVSCALDETGVTWQVEALERSGRVLCVVSPFEVASPVERFSFADVFERDGINRIQELVDMEYLADHVADTLRTMLSVPDVDRLMALVRTAVDSAQGRLGRRLLPDARVGALLHLGCLFDRLLRGEPSFVFEGKERAVDADRALYEVVRSELDTVARELGVSVAEDDVCYVMTFFSPENCSGQGSA